MITEKDLTTCRKIVREIRRESHKVLNRNKLLYTIVDFIDTVYKKNKATRLFPTNIATGNTVSHSHPKINDRSQGVVTIDHGFVFNKIKVDTAFSTFFTTVNEKTYYEKYRLKYKKYINKIRLELKKRKLSNFDLAVIFDDVFKKYRFDVCKSLMGHRIEKGLHEEPYLQMGLLNNKMITNVKPLIDGFYAIEIYFSKDLKEERVQEVKDKKRSIYKKNDIYLTYSELNKNNLKPDEQYSPIKYLGSIKNIFQIEETFLLENNQLICISSTL